MAHLLFVTISIRVMTAGQGYRYLLNSVVTGDGDRDAASALTRYYLDSGTPPGTWMGSGLGGLSGRVDSGGQVSEEQLRRLMGFGQDPNTGEQLGRPYRKFATASDRVERRLTRLPEDLTPAELSIQTGMLRFSGTLGHCGETKVEFAKDCHRCRQMVHVAAELCNGARAQR